MKMDEAFSSADRDHNDSTNMFVDEDKPNMKAVHALELEKAVERIMRGVVGDSTPESVKFTPPDSMDAAKFLAEEHVKDLITAHSRFEHFFSKSRLIYSYQNPEKVLEAAKFLDLGFYNDFFQKMKEMRKAFHRKEALINRHHQNLAKWQNVLRNGIPPPPEPTSEPLASQATPSARGPAAAIDTAARATPAPRQSPAAVPDNVRAPSTPSVPVLSPAASITSLPPQPLSYPPPQPAPSPYPHTTGPTTFSQQPTGAQPAMYQQRSSLPQPPQPQSQPSRPPQGVPNMHYASMMRPGNQGYAYQPQPPGYGAPRPGVSPLSAMLQSGPNPSMQQQQMRIPSPNTNPAGVYGQNVSPRMPGQPGQWRPNLGQMNPTAGQMQPGYSSDDGSYGQPPMHQGPPGQQ